jgi:hypothetical protein
MTLHLPKVRMMYSPASHFLGAVQHRDIRGICSNMTHASNARRFATWVVASLSFIGVAASNAPAAITTYTDLTLFNAAITSSGASTQLEPFDAGGLSSFTHVATTNGGITPATGFLSGSVWHDAVSRLLGENATFSCTLVGAMRGAGAFWDTSTNAHAQGLILTVNYPASAGGGFQSFAQLQQVNGTFFGWISTIPFQSFTITAGTGPGGLEGWDMDNLTFVVPEPATLAVVAPALIWSIGVARRRRS